MVAKIIISILALLNVIFIPIYDVWGGLFPEHPETTFIDAMEAAAEGHFEYWVVIFTLIYFIPAICMFFSSFTKSNVAFKTFASLSFVAAIIALLNCIGQQLELFEHLEYVLGPEETSISIGTWIGLFLDFLALVAVPKPKEDKPTAAAAPVAYVPVQYPVNNYQQPVQTPVYNSNNYQSNPAIGNGYSQPAPNTPGVYYRCQKCNSLLEPDQQFCIVCGTPKTI